MKCRHFALALFAVVAASLSADEACGEAGASTLYLGPQAYYVDLSIDNTESKIGGLAGLDNFNSHPKGMLWGVNGGYAYQRPCALYGRLDFNYGEGTLKKDRSLKRRVWEYEWSAVAGYTFGSDDSCWLLTSYAGFDYLSQNFRVSKLDVHYRNYLYRVPVGIKAEFCFSALCAVWSVGLDAVALPQVDSTVKISKLHGSRWLLAKRTDWVVALPIKYYSDCLPLSVKLSLFWKRVATGASKAVAKSGAALGWPASKWNAYGAAVDLEYNF